jgi:hypothetical protein
MPAPTALLSALTTLVSIAIPLSSLTAAQPARSQSPEASVRPAPPAATAAAVVTPLVRYSGVALRTDGSPQSGELSATFSVYRDQTGGEPLWRETQTVTSDAAGRFEVYLGAASVSGLPADLFGAGAARWIEVQFAGSLPQPRILLASVPYALKAADAATLGGLPASAFALAGAASASGQTATSAAPDASALAVTTPGGTAGYLPVFSSATAIDDSALFQSGTKIGIGTKTPSAALDIAGAVTARGALTMEVTGVASATASKTSEAIDFEASSYNSSTKKATYPLFALQAEAAGNNTATPAGTLNLLYGNGSTPAETGLSITNKGIINFATGQTFPGGSGTITGVTTTSPLTGSATTGSVALGLNLSALETSLNPKYAQLGAADVFAQQVTFSKPVVFASSQTFPGSGGTITGITTSSPLTGGATKGSVALSLNLTALETSLNPKYAQLGAANTFTAPITFASGQTFPGTSTITSITAGTGLTGGGTTGVVKLSLDPKAVPTLTGSPAFMGGAADGLQGDTTGSTLNTAGVLGVAGTASGATTGIAGVWGDAYAHVGVLGTSNEYSGVQGISTNSYGVQGSSTSNTAVLGTSSSGTGVSGLSTTNSGVAGYTAANTINTAGVNGKAGALSGITQVIAGVWGDSYQQVGVEGTSNQSDGVYGQSTVYNGVVGVSNVASGVSGTSNSGTGVAGSSTSGAGMIGYTVGNTLNTAGTFGFAGPRTSFTGIAGVWGDASAHVGVQGTSNVYTGVQGSSVSGPGVQGNSTSGNGVHGVSQSTSGIFAETSSSSAGDAAVYGLSHNGALGVFGFSPKFGIEGESGGNSATGALSSTFYNGPGAIWGDGGAYAITGTTDDGVAGQFINNSAGQVALYASNDYNGNSSVATFYGQAGGCTFFGNGDVLCTGTISDVAKVDNGTRAVTSYGVQSAESWSEDAGSGQLVNGVAHVAFDPTFSQTVNTGVDYHVFLTPNGDSDGLYVTNKTAQGFEVHEQHGGHANIAFDYRIMAKRAGHEQERLADVTGRMRNPKEKAATALPPAQAAN